MTTLGGLILAIWLIVSSQAATSSTFALIMGLVAAVCFLLDLFGVALPIPARRRTVP